MPFYADMPDLIGKTMVSVTNNDNAILFETDTGEKYSLHHEQDCCEDVYLDEIHGDLDDLVGAPIVQSDESQEVDENASESGTWSFYRFATLKGYVTVKFYGESNGYYSETANLYKIG